MASFLLFFLRATYFWYISPCALTSIFLFKKINAILIKLKLQKYIIYIESLFIILSQQEFALRFLYTFVWET